MPEQTPEQRRPKRSRSPNYPGTDLAQAIERAHTLYKAEGKHATPGDAILGHWGYKPKSGPGWSLFSALKKFGLLLDQGGRGNRKARLSDEALAIILDDRKDSSERLRLIQEAALKPPLHNTLWYEYGGSLPSDANLRFKLLREHGFTESGVKEFIPQFKSTVAFAQLLDGGKLSEEGEDSAQPVGEPSMAPQTELKEPVAKSVAATAAIAAVGVPTVKRYAKVIQLPIAPEEWAALQAQFPLTEEKWVQMLAVLNAMKPALVAESSVEADEERPEPPEDAE